MNETLEFPEIAAPAEPRTALATAAAGALDLEKINLTDLALAKFGDWRGNVAAVTANLGTLVLDLSTQARVNDAKSLRERLINVPRAEARKVSKALRSKFAATGKDVAAAEDQIVAAWDQTETLITPKIDAAQKTLDDEKARRAAEEEARKEKHRSGIANIRCYLDRCHAPGMTSQRIANGIKALAELTFGPDWEEFQVPAANAQCETLEAMRQLHAQVLGREQEAARQEQIRQENERQAEANRIEAKRIADEAAEIRRRAEELDAAERRQRDQAEDARKAALAKQREEDTAAESARITERLGAQQVLKAEPATADATDRDAPASASPHGGATGAGQAAAAAPAGERWTDEDPDAATKLPGEPVEPADQGAEVDGRPLYHPLRRTITIELDQTPPPPLPPAPEPATIKLGDLSAWAGVTMTRVFVEGLGITPTIEGTRILFTPTQKRELKAALLRHVERLEA